MKKVTLFSLSLLLISLHLFAQQSDTITLNLLNPTYPSTFNFIGNGYWNETYNEVDYTFFKSQIFSFSHLIEGLGSSYGGYVWNGFTVCNSGDNENHNSQGWWRDYEWGCMAGGGIMTDAQGNVMLDETGKVMVDNELPYLVGYWNYMIEPEWWEMFGDYSPLEEPAHCFQILLDDDDEYEAVGMYVNIHPWTYYSNLYGSGLARPLNQPGDYFKLIIHGYNPDGSESGNSVEHIFAQYANSQLTQSAEWEWVDLSSLGEIGGFYCTMATTIANSAGPVAPMYFCMDKIQVRTKDFFTFVPVTNITNVPDSTTVGVPLTLTGTVVPENATNKTITWSVQSAGTTGATISPAGEGWALTTTAAGVAVVCATIANGIAEGEDYVQDFEIKVTEIIGIDENELSYVQVYSYGNSIYIKNETSVSIKSVEVFDITGRLIYQAAINDYETGITLHAPSGIYYVKLISRKNTAVITKAVLVGDK